MLPFIKVFSLLVRVLVRPVVARTKKIHLSNTTNQNEYIRRWFIFLGNWFNKQEMRINKSTMNIKTQDDFFVKPLSEETAVEKGVEFFYEVLIYSTLIAFPVYELYVSSTETQLKTQKLNAQLQQMEQRLEQQNKVVEEDTILLQQQRAINDHLVQKVLSLQGLLQMNLDSLKNVPFGEKDFAQVRQIETTPTQQGEGTGS